MAKDSFLGKRILVLTAHPDDEQLAAGTMYENHNAGGKTFLVCATAGEKGKSHLKKPTTDAQLKKIRKAELLKAAKILKVDKVIFLGLPDAGLRGQKKKVFEKTRLMANKIKPEIILSFGPDGISAHWDHITIAEAARAIAKRMRIPLFGFTLHPKGASRRRKIILARRKFGDYADLHEYRKGDIKLPINVRIKRRALNSHRSQFSEGGWSIFDTEHFVREAL